MRHPDRSLAALAPLADPVRRALYELVAAADEPVDRDRAAAGAGITRRLAAFHLDKLVAAGLLEAEYRRRGTRTGPGAGRPAKFYRRSARGVEVSLPARRYDLAGDILAAAVEAVAGAADVARDRAGAAGRAMAARTGRGLDAVVGRLLSLGYEPHPAPDGAIRLRNCPFDALVRQHRDLVCGMNLAMLSGVAAAALPSHAAVLAPEDGYCCVALRPTADPPRPAGGPPASPTSPGTR